LCGSQNKQRLFHYTALTDWYFVAERAFVYCAVGTESINVIEGNFFLEGLKMSTNTYDVNSYSSAAFG